MVLDAIVEDRDLMWLGTSEEKIAHLTTLIRIEATDLPGQRAAPRPLSQTDARQPIATGDRRRSR
jgi:hypothetical protein